MRESSPRARAKRRSEEATASYSNRDSILYRARPTRAFSLRPTTIMFVSRRVALCSGTRARYCYLPCGEGRCSLGSSTLEASDQASESYSRSASVQAAQRVIGGALPRPGDRDCEPAVSSYSTAGPHLAPPSPCMPRAGFTPQPPPHTNPNIQTPRMTEEGSNPTRQEAECEHQNHFCVGGKRGRATRWVYGV